MRTCLSAHHICDDQFHGHDEDVHEITNPLSLLSYSTEQLRMSMTSVNFLRIKSVYLITKIYFIRLSHQNQSLDYINISIRSFAASTTVQKKKKTNLSSRRNEFISQRMYLDPSLGIQ